MWVCTKPTEPPCVLSRSRFLTLVSLLRAEPAMTSASADTPAITMAPHKDISGRGWGGRVGRRGHGGGIALDTFMGEVRAPLLLSCPPPPSSSLSPAVFVQPPFLFTRSLKELLSLVWPAHPLPHRLISAFPPPSIKSVWNKKKLYSSAFLS